MSQSLSKIYLHLIFSTKNRGADILPKYRDELFSYIGGIINGLGGQSLAVGGTANHVHILFCLSRSKTVSDMVRDVKSNSAKWFKGKIGCNFSWQDGYGVFSVSQSQVETVRRYIARQEEHHRRMSFQEEYHAFLKNYDIPYDERYVWD